MRSYILVRVGGISFIGHRAVTAMPTDLVCQMDGTFRLGSHWRCPRGTRPLVRRATDNKGAPRPPASLTTPLQFVIETQKQGLISGPGPHRTTKALCPCAQTSPTSEFQSILEELPRSRATSYATEVKLCYFDNRKVHNVAGCRLAETSHVSETAAAVDNARSRIAVRSPSLFLVIAIVRARGACERSPSSFQA